MLAFNRMVELDQVNQMVRNGQSGGRQGFNLDKSPFTPHTIHQNTPPPIYSQDSSVGEWLGLIGEGLYGLWVVGVSWFQGFTMSIARQFDTLLIEPLIVVINSLVYKIKPLPIWEFVEDLNQVNGKNNQVENKTQKTVQNDRAIPPTPTPNQQNQQNIDPTSTTTQLTSSPTVITTITRNISRLNTRALLLIDPIINPSSDDLHYKMIIFVRECWSHFHSVTSFLTTFGQMSRNLITSLLTPLFKLASPITTPIINIFNSLFGLNDSAEDYFGQDSQNSQNGSNWGQHGPFSLDQLHHYSVPLTTSTLANNNIPLSYLITQLHHLIAQGNAFASRHLSRLLIQHIPILTSDSIFSFKHIIHKVQQLLTVGYRAEDQLAYVDLFDIHSLGLPAADIIPTHSYCLAPSLFTSIYTDKSQIYNTDIFTFEQRGDEDKVSQEGHLYDENTPGLHPVQHLPDHIIDTLLESMPIINTYDPSRELNNIKVVTMLRLMTQNQRSEFAKIVNIDLNVLTALIQRPFLPTDRSIHHTVTTHDDTDGFIMANTFNTESQIYAAMFNYVVTWMRGWMGGVYGIPATQVYYFDRNNLKKPLNRGKLSMLPQDDTCDYLVQLAVNVLYGRNSTLVGKSSKSLGLDESELGQNVSNQSTVINTGMICFGSDCYSPGTTPIYRSHTMVLAPDHNLAQNMVEHQTSTAVGSPVWSISYLYSIMYGLADVMTSFVRLNMVYDLEDVVYTTYQQDEKGQNHSLTITTKTIKMPKIGQLSSLYKWLQATWTYHTVTNIHHTVMYYLHLVVAL